jgi:hypothetical protein
MAKKAASKSDRTDPKQNKSLAIRNILKSTKKAKASEVVAAVKKEYGHDVSVNMVYMVKTKKGIAKAHKTKGASGKPKGTGMSSSNQWVEAIRHAQELLKATGSVANANALLNAIAG